MPMKDNREYRSFAALQTHAPDEGEQGGAMVLEGYALTFDQPYELSDGLYEVIDRHALDGADLSDVIMQYDHQGAVLARLRNQTLALMPDEHGLYVRADVSKSPRGRDLYEEVSNGLVDRMSFGFTVAEGGWDYDPATRTSTIRSISKVFDVSAVSMPANPNTEISARSYLNGVIEGERQELSRRQQEARERLALTLAL